MKKNILIGGAWPYANYLLHIGHYAALLPGDVIAKYYRQCGDNVIYVSGSDCHGTPITERAKKESKTPEEIASFYYEEAVKTFNKAEFEYDMYTATMSEEHKKYAQEFFKIIYDNGYIYEKEEEQDYCEVCNQFLSDREIEGICPNCGGTATGEQCEACFATLNSDEVKDKHCKTCKNIPVLRKNKNLYFKLSEFQNDLVEYAKSKEDIWRKNVTGEFNKFINMGLIDRACTRQLTWGVEVPLDGYDDKRIYVWIEAVLGYVTTCKRVCEERGIDFEKFITDENLISYYSMGKDNIPFHTVIYPALLLALKTNYKLPDYIISCEFYNMNDTKMSKSKGNLITINDFIDISSADSTRYYVIAYGPEKKDANFSVDDYIEKHNKFLVGVLGNFVNRNLAFLVKKFDGIAKEGHIDKKIRELTIKKYKDISALYEKGELKAAMETVFDYINAANKYYDENTPWVFAKEDLNKFNDITYTCLFMIANIKNFIYPVMPTTSKKIASMLSLKEATWQLEELSGDIKLNNVEILFERIEKNE